MKAAKEKSKRFYLILKVTSKTKMFLKFHFLMACSICLPRKQKACSFTLVLFFLSCKLLLNLSFNVRFYFLSVEILWFMSFSHLGSFYFAHEHQYFS